MSQAAMHDYRKDEGGGKCYSFSSSIEIFVSMYTNCDCSCTQLGYGNWSGSWTNIRWIIYVPYNQEEIQGVVVSALVKG